MTKRELKLYLVRTADYTQEEVDEMDSTQLMDAWLTYEGIIGYTKSIIEIYKAAHE